MIGVELAGPVPAEPMCRAIEPATPPKIVVSIGTANRAITKCRMKCRADFIFLEMILTQVQSNG